MSANDEARKLSNELLMLATHVEWQSRSLRVLSTDLLYGLVTPEQAQVQREQILSASLPLPALVLGSPA